MRTAAWRRALVVAAGLLVIVGSVSVTGAARAARSDGTAWLGVFTQSLTAELREGLDYSGGGVLVQRVVSDSPAGRGGVKRGDVIVRVDSHSVDSPDDLASAIQASSVGETVVLTVVRDGARESLRVKLADRPESDTPAGDEFQRPSRIRVPKQPEAPEAPESPEAPEADEAPMAPQKLRIASGV